MIGQVALKLREAFQAPLPSRSNPTPVLEEVAAKLPPAVQVPIAPQDRKATPKRSARRRPTRRLVRVWLAGIEPKPAMTPTRLEHAQQLLAYLQGDSSVRGRNVLAADVMRIYPQFCAELGITPYPWNSVGVQLRALTGGKKIYVWCEGRRRCAYSIPARKSRLDRATLAA